MINQYYLSIFTTILSLTYKHWNLDLVVTRIRDWGIILLLPTTFVTSELALPLEYSWLIQKALRNAIYKNTEQYAHMLL